MKRIVEIDDANFEEGSFKVQPTCAWSSSPLGWSFFCHVDGEPMDEIAHEFVEDPQARYRQTLIGNPNLGSVMI